MKKGIPVSHCLFGIVVKALVQKSGHFNSSPGLDQSQLGDLKPVILTQPYNKSSFKKCCQENCKGQFPGVKTDWMAQFFPLLLLHSTTNRQTDEWHDGNNDTTLHPSLASSYGLHTRSISYHLRYAIVNRYISNSMVKRLV